MIYGFYGDFTCFRSGVCRVSLVSQSVDNITNLIAQHAGPVVVVFDVAHYDLDANGRTVKDLAQLAHTLAIPWRDFDGGILAIESAGFPAFVDGISQYNFRCFDARRWPPAPVVARQVEAARNTARRQDGPPVLHLLDGARLFVSSHDNVFLTVEARDPALVRAVFARTLEDQVAAALAAARGRPGPDIPVAPVPDEIIDYFWSTLPTFTIHIGEGPTKPGRVRVAFADSNQAHRPPTFEPVGHIDYDLRTSRWVHRYR